MASDECFTIVLSVIVTQWPTASISKEVTKKFPVVEELLYHGGPQIHVSLRVYGADPEHSFPMHFPC